MERYMSSRLFLLVALLDFCAAYISPGVNLPGPRASGKMYMSHQSPLQTRRDILALSTASLLAAGIPAPTHAKRPACGDVETCREKGQKKFEEAEKEKGDIIRLGNGVSYRESRKGTGDLIVKPGDVVDISFQVLKGNGYYMYSVGYDKEIGLRDLGETYKLTLGNRDVPVAVEQALIGAKKGSVRRVEMPPAFGFDTSGWRPAPQTFEGKQRIEGYQKVLRGNGLQPGYGAVLLFEFEVQKIRPSTNGT